MATITNVSRRRFLTALGLTGGGLVLGVGFAKRGALMPGTPAAELFAPSVYLSIDPTGLVTIVAHRSEMGQGVRTAMPMIVADELEADWARVTIVQATGDPKYGDQNTDGSTSGRNFFKPLREAGATARAMLEAAAARQWGVPASEVQARNHEVVHAASGRRLGFGALAAAASRQPVPAADAITLKPISAFRYIGKGLPIVDGPDIVTGKAVFATDVVRPGMKHAVIARPPVYGGRARRVESAAALKVSGVERVITLAGTPPPAGFQPLGGVAVIARNTWAALQGREQLQIDWDPGPNASYDSEAYAARLEETARKPCKVVRNEGDVEGALAAAARVVRADYYAPHLAHATMEPPAAVAEVTGDRCEVWAATQSPQGARDEIARGLGIPKENVTVHVTLLGGAFGRKSKPDFVVEAALLAKEVGAPVKVTWSREDELRHGYYHTVTAQHLEGALDAGGRVTGWLHRSVFPSISSTFAPNVTYPDGGELGLGFVDVPFAVPALRCESGPAEAHVRIGWFRAVSNVPHAFAIGSFVGELAAAAGRDQRDVLLELIGPPRHVTPTLVDIKYDNYGASADVFPIDTARLRRVVELASDKAGWGTRLPSGHGLGIAVHRSFLTYVCTVVEVAVASDGRISVPRVVTAVDCGIAIHPERVRSQMEGAAVMGVSLALYGQLTFKNGQAQQTNFDSFELARLTDAPRSTEVIIVESDQPPGGVGEPGLPPFAPALCNAIYAAAGQRIRRLPIGPRLAV
jgi:isoquinoline 1-oxidoreductase subunit beta